MPRFSFFHFLFFESDLGPRPGIMAFNLHEKWQQQEDWDLCSVSSHFRFLFSSFFCFFIFFSVLSFSIPLFFHSTLHFSCFIFVSFYVFPRFFYFSSFISCPYLTKSPYYQTHNTYVSERTLSPVLIRTRSSELIIRI